MDHDDVRARADVFSLSVTETVMEQVRDLVKAKLLVEEYSKEHEYDGPTGTDDNGCDQRWDINRH